MALDQVIIEKGRRLLSDFDESEYDDRYVQNKITSFFRQHGVDLLNGAELLLLMRESAKENNDSSD